jgi:hypothetical protein
MGFFSGIKSVGVIPFFPARPLLPQSFHDSDPLKSQDPARRDRVATSKFEIPGFGDFP